MTNSHIFIAKSILKKSGFREKELLQNKSAMAGMEEIDSARKNCTENRWKELRLECLTDDVSYALVKTLAGYEAAVQGAAERYEPSVVARYIITMASAFNKFYHECPILNAKEEEKRARLALVDAVQRVLKDACGLLGMECPEEM